MTGLRLQILPLRPGVAIPRYATDGAAGLDLSAALPVPVVIEPGAFATIPTGFVVVLPKGHEGQVRPRSGLAARHGVTVLNSPGTIDSDYRGEIKVILYNAGREPFRLERGMRIAQLVVAPVSRAAVQVVEQLSETARAAGGFGSTGSKIP